MRFSIPTGHTKVQFGRFFELKVGRGAGSRGCMPGMPPETQIREDFSIRGLVYLPEVINYFFTKGIWFELSSILLVKCENCLLSDFRFSKLDS